MTNIRLLWRHSKRWLFTEWRFHLVGGLLVLAWSLYYAFKGNRPDIFSRAGAIMCLAGGFMTFRRFLRGAEDEYLRDTGAADQSPFRIIHPLTAKGDARKQDYSAMGWGIWYIIIGTFVWGYGDLLLIWIHVCKINSSS